MRGHVSHIGEMKMLKKFWSENMNRRIRGRCEDNIKINLNVYYGGMEAEFIWSSTETSGGLL
jgi:hypothetical protein